MNKIFSIASTVLATVVMGTALVYYNFIDKKKAIEGVAVGDVCPDFTVDTMVATDGTFGFAEEDYNLREHNGKVRVINFWATWCSACKHELPYFNDFAVAYPEVEVIAVCGASGSASIVQKWMNNEKEDAQAKGWTDYKLTFGFYGDDKTVYEDLGGTGFWPMTVIVDEEGVIRYSAEVEMDFEKLENAVLPLLND
jgi:thiol-disulfide isomerase/thioredoxin